MRALTFRAAKVRKKKQKEERSGKKFALNGISRSPILRNAPSRPPLSASFCSQLPPEGTIASAKKCIKFPRRFPCEGRGGTLSFLLKAGSPPRRFPSLLRGEALSFFLKAGSSLRRFPSLLRGGVRGGVASAVAVPFRSSLRRSETFDPTPNPSPSRGGEGPSAFS